VAGRVIEEDFGPSQLRTFVVPADPSAPLVETDLIERPL
jgi:alpha-mannosidase